MDATPDRWIARNMAAACVASRWVSGASLVFTVLAAALPFVAGFAASALVSLAAAAGAVQIYLAWRIEFDRRIFEILAEASDAAEAAQGFDRAMEAIDCAAAPGKRDIGQRAAGLMGLVKAAACTLILQIGLIVSAAWVQSWAS